MYILGIRIDTLTKAEVLEKIQALFLSHESGKQIVTTNPEFILTAQKDEVFKNIINHAWLSVPDGYGIKLAAKYLDLIKNKNITRYILRVTHYFLLGLKTAWWGIVRSQKLNVIKDVVTGTDLIPEICRLTTDDLQLTTKIFLLGGFGETPQLVAENLKKQFNNLEIDYSVFEVDNLIDKINNSQPDILFVALNHPRAQKWINENLPQLPTVKLAMGVGGAFDYLSGKVKRAPQKWQLSFEWLYRLIKQPQRIRRIFNAWPRFPWKIFTNSIKS